ncbi:MAG: hypothetical protein GY850_14085, partial [bacterium]|nr:hypothetical protein [bacterium]
AELVSHFAPRLWLFGHHHKWFEHKDGETAYYGLPSVWKGFGLLDSDYRYQVVKHLIPYPDDRSWLDKLLGKMRIINPDLPTD